MHHHDQIRIGLYDGLRLMLQNVIIIGGIIGIAINTLGTEQWLTGALRVLISHRDTAPMITGGFLTPKENHS